MVTSEAHRFATACVVTPHYLASHAGAAVLHDGGNAMDAAIAANLVLAVVAPYTCGVGGDCFAIVWDGALHGYNGSGRAPAAATLAAVAERLAADGMARPADGPSPAPPPAMPRHGPVPITVPGAVDAWFALVDRFGSRPFARLAGAALGYAENGFPLTASGARRIRAGQPVDGRWGPWDEIYGRSAPGVRLTQPELARTLRLVATGGREAFYRGEIAAAMAGHVQGLGGLLDGEDLAAHAGEWVKPVEGRYRDLAVAELPPNSQGTAALLALHLVDQAGPLPAEGAERQHRMISAVVAALNQRDAHLTDPDHMLVRADALADPALARAAAHPVGAAAGPGGPAPPRGARGPPEPGGGRRRGRPGPPGGATGTPRTCAPSTATGSASA